MEAAAYEKRTLLLLAHNHLSVVTPTTIWSISPSKAIQKNSNNVVYEKEIEREMSGRRQGEPKRTGLGGTWNNLIFVLSRPFVRWVRDGYEYFSLFSDNTLSTRSTYGICQKYSKINS